MDNDDNKEKLENDVEETSECSKRMRSERNATISACRTLYGRSDDSWGCGCWECGDGWIYPLKKLSHGIEFLNLTVGERFGARIVADQVKEKFGTLRFYYTIHPAYPWWTKIFSFPFSAVHKFIEKRVNFGYRYENWRRIPTKNILLHSVSTVLFKIASFLDLSFLVEAARGTAHDVVWEYLHDQVDELIAKAEKECYGLCEICGSWIGKDGTRPRCQTTGWIRYVCKDCAEKYGWKFEVVDD